MRTFLRKFLGALRWILAPLALISLPAAGRGLVKQVHGLFNDDGIPFLVGAGLILLLWFMWWRRTRWARFITTIEHESLHAIIGMLTLIPVRELKVKEDGSGHVLFEPPGHWLLYLAPYFIPLLLIIEIGLVRLLDLDAPFEGALLGAVMALSILGHLRQFHPKQTDFSQAGWAFSATFLPTAFLASYGCAFALITGGSPSAMMDFLSDWAHAGYTDSQTAWAWLRDLLAG